MNPSLRLIPVSVLCCLVFVSCPGITAQQTTAADSTDYRLELNVNSVLVPVVVRDQQGQAVGDLKKEDFQVFEGNKQRAISGFTVQQRGIAETGSGQQ
jgi:hypothetical protein